MTPVDAAARSLADIFGEEYIFEGANGRVQRRNYADGRAHYIKAVTAVLQAIREPGERAIEVSSARLDAIAEDIPRK